MFLVMLLLGGFLLSVGAPGCHVRAPCPVVQCTGVVSFTVTSCGSRVTCELWLTHHANVVLLCSWLFAAYIPGDHQVQAYQAGQMLAASTT